MEGALEVHSLNKPFIGPFSFKKIQLLLVTAAKPLLKSWNSGGALGNWPNIIKAVRDSVAFFCSDPHGLPPCPVTEFDLSTEIKGTQNPKAKLSGIYQSHMILTHKFTHKPQVCSEKSAFQEAQNCPLSDSHGAARSTQSLTVFVTTTTNWTLRGDQHPAYLTSISESLEICRALVRVLLAVFSWIMTM